MSVYILYSTSLDSYYIGQTEDLPTRLDRHLTETFKGSFTTRASDWLLHLVIKCNSRKQAVNLEAHIKRMKSRIYLENLKKYPEIVERLKQQYQ